MSAPTTAEVRETAALCDDPAVRAIQVPLSLEPVIAAAVRVGASIYARDYALPLAEHRDALAAEVARLRKLFDDAGQGEHDVLALVDHYQADAMRMSAEVARLRSVLGSIATLDESDTDDLPKALTDWDAADVYASLRAAITSARMALDDAAKGAGR